MASKRQSSWCAAVGFVFFLSINLAIGKRIELRQAICQHGDRVQQLNCLYQKGEISSDLSKIGLLAHVFHYVVPNCEREDTQQWDCSDLIKRPWLEGCDFTSGCTSKPGQNYGLCGNCSWASQMMKTSVVSAKLKSGSLAYAEGNAGFLINTTDVMHNGKGPNFGDGDIWCAHSCSGWSIERRCEPPGQEEPQTCGAGDSDWCPGALEQINGNIVGNDYDDCIFGCGKFFSINTKPAWVDRSIPYDENPGKGDPSMPKWYNQGNPYRPEDLDRALEVFSEKNPDPNLETFNSNWSMGDWGCYKPTYNNLVMSTESFQKKLPESISAFYVTSVSDIERVKRLCKIQDMFLKMYDLQTNDAPLVRLDLHKQTREKHPDKIVTEVDCKNFEFTELDEVSNRFFR